MGEIKIASQVDLSPRIIKVSIALSRIIRGKDGLNGESAYAVEILSSTGTTSINHNIDITLTARVL
ncbi:MAG: hypothetical protein RRY23_08795, partial [Alistipes sp.]